jgi:hypothetical protein
VKKNLCIIITEAVFILLFVNSCFLSPVDYGTAPLILPVIVSDYFKPTGYMGDGEEPGFIIIENDHVPIPLPEGTEGESYTVRYESRGDQGWAGVYWQYPANNWGARKGLFIDTNATAISFWAAGKNGGEQIEFIAGLGFSEHDPEGWINKTIVSSMTTEWKKYSIDLTIDPRIRQQIALKGMVAPFGWSSAGTIVFYLAGITIE